MGSFTSPLIITPFGDKHWKLRYPFEYHVGSKQSNIIISVPAGFITDFASIPRIFWTILPPWGRYGKAAIIHDYLYVTHRFSRKQADDIFLEAMGVLKVSKWKRWVMYRSVRAWGWTAWNCKTNKK